MAQRRGFGLGLSAERGALCSLSRCLHFSIASVPTTNHPNREIERKNDAESTSLPTDILLCSGSNRGEPLRSFHSRESTSDSDRPILSVGFSPPELYLFKSVELASSLYFSEWYGFTLRLTSLGCFTSNMGGSMFFRQDRGGLPLRSRIGGFLVDNLQFPTIHILLFLKKGLYLLLSRHEPDTRVCKLGDR